MMEYAYSIVMAAFAAGLILFGGLMALTRDYKMLPYRSRASVKPKDPKRYARQLGKVILLVSLSPALSALVGLWNIPAAAVVLIASMVFLIWRGTKLMDGVE